MSNNKRRFFLRYISIIQKLRTMESSFDEIKKYLDKQSRDSGNFLSIEIRTFQRDIIDIRDIFNIDIKCNSQNKYYISDDGDVSYRSRMLETFDQLDLLYKAKNHSKFIYYETRVPSGSQNMHRILHGIHNCTLISFRHEKNWEDNITYRTVEPYALKESQYRWYLIAKDRKDGKVKTFALDRISELHPEKEKFIYPKEIDMDRMFKHSFGIMTDSKEVKEIILSFDMDQRKYLGSLRIHDSQTVLLDTEEEYRISLKMLITYDLKKEILSYGDLVEVISPKSLRKEIREIHRRADKMNS